MKTDTAIKILQKRKSFNVHQAAIFMVGMYELDDFADYLLGRYNGKAVKPPVAVFDLIDPDDVDDTYGEYESMRKSIDLLGASGNDTVTAKQLRSLCNTLDIETPAFLITSTPEVADVSVPTNNCNTEEIVALAEEGKNSSTAILRDRKRAASIPNEGYYRISDVLRFISISKSGLYAKIKSGEIPLTPVKLGPRTTVYSCAELKAYLNNLQPGDKK